jgi:hypothetical protein
MQTLGSFDIGLQAQMHILLILLLGGGAVLRETGVV